MAANNLRIIYDNVGDTATLSASTTRGVTNASNLQKDTKSYVWQSTGLVDETIQADLDTAAVINAVVLAFVNFSAACEIKVEGFNSDIPEFDTGFVLAQPPTPLGSFDWGEPLGGNYYAFTGGNYARIYFPEASVDSIIITIRDPSNSNTYLEVSRLIVGRYWSPVFNHPYGASNTYVDDSQSVRTEANNLVSQRSGRYNKVSFSLEYMQQKDRTNWNGLVKRVGTHKPIFVSLYPEDSDPEKEQSFQLYGKLSAISATSHPVYTMFATSVDIEEI